MDMLMLVLVSTQMVFHQNLLLGSLVFPMVGWYCLSVDYYCLIVGYYCLTVGYYCLTVGYYYLTVGYYYLTVGYFPVGYLRLLFVVFVFVTFLKSSYKTVD